MIKTAPGTKPERLELAGLAQAIKNPLFGERVENYFFF